MKYVLSILFLVLIAAIFTIAYGENIVIATSGVGNERDVYAVNVTTSHAKDGRINVRGPGIKIKGLKLDGDLVVIETDTKLPNDIEPLSHTYNISTKGFSEAQIEP